MKNRLAIVAKTPRLLIASDFDGTLGPIVEHPDLARPSDGIMDALQRATLLPQTAVAVVSGRALEDLRTRAAPPPGCWLVGGHGAEIVGPRFQHHPPDVSHALDAITEQLNRVAPISDGFFHERKPTSIAVHYRQVDPVRAASAVSAIERTIAAPAGLHVQHGKMVIEVMAVESNKGKALTLLRHLTGATAIVYIGDDVTDEDAFASLGDQDVAMKIGDGPTAADFCVSSIEEAHAMLTDLIGQRAAWLEETKPHPIQHHSILSDQRTLAIVSSQGAVTWMCHPRVDSGAIFASMLDGDNVGTWTIGPANGTPATGQRYLGDTFTLETSWPTMRVTDYLDTSMGRSFQRAGRTDLLRVVEGAGRVRVIFSPRLDFGRVRTKLIPVEGGLIVEGVADPIVLVSPGVVWAIEDRDGNHTAVAEIELHGSPLVFELRGGTRALAPARTLERDRRSQTERAWSSWAASLRLPPVAPELCKRSALILRSLCYGPTGAILAAGTTSLPETAGGVRNWDYRFCWPRDAAIGAAALVRLGNTGAAMKYLDWLLGIVDRCSGPERLRPIYTVTGDELGHEAELSHLSGYATSRPVRIGNAAAQQVQIDVFGPIVDLVYLLADAGAAISPDHWRLIEAMATAVERSWQEPDHGIWEVRTEKRHHVHSKIMCWLALDRAVLLAEQFAGVRRESWETLRDRIRDEVLERGFSKERGAFITAYDYPEIDASALTAGLVGLVDPTDVRFVSTVAAVLSQLVDNGTVYRYLYDDAIPGPEGGFHLCTGWLIEALVRVGRRSDAMALFEGLCKSAGPTGLLTEEWCPVQRTGLGNVPQTYSHAALINCAVALSSST